MSAIYMAECPRFAGDMHTRDTNARLLRTKLRIPATLHLPSHYRIEPAWSISRTSSSKPTLSLWRNRTLEPVYRVVIFTAPHHQGSKMHGEYRRWLGEQDKE